MEGMTSLMAPLLTGICLGALAEKGQAAVNACLVFILDIINVLMLFVIHYRRFEIYM